MPNHIPTYRPLPIYIYITVYRSWNVGILKYYQDL